MSYERVSPDPMYRGDTYYKGSQPTLPHVITYPPNGDNLRPLGVDSTESLRQRVEDSAGDEGWRSALKQ